MQHSSRYLIGIDLGTTNSVLSYIDTALPSSEFGSTINTFEVPQLAGFGELRSVPALPSFLYFPTPDELQGAMLRLPWEEEPTSIAGVIARDHGSLVPARQVTSAKSWLSHSGVDRQAKILPRESQPPLVSPVDASGQYLQHLRRAWNHVMAHDAADESVLLERQEIVLTVPASFDEEARELTVEAANKAGLENIILLEEPLAAFYAWMKSHRQTMAGELNDGELVLICDIGGGTTDFSLVRAHVDGENVAFERKAIGEHLLLGGDNLDLALARTLEQRLRGTRFSMRQRHALQRACCAAKERLLGDPDLSSVPINILGSGRAVVGQLLTTELTHHDVFELLTTGFLPLTAANELPKRGRTAGLRELGLPYAGDPAITKHLAAFLRQAAASMGSGAAGTSMARPDAVLFNGGFCEPPVVRERIVEAIGAWFDEAGERRRPRLLRNEDMGAAVATGAAHYAEVRRGIGTRIRAGSARTYFIGLRAEAGLQGVCVLPRGVEEGTTLPPANREFSALANRPVSFTLLSSRTRPDGLGEIANLDPDEVHRHAPLVTLLRYGKRLREQELSVRLQAKYTEVGTLEIWCESTDSPHRWRLQFELRGEHKEATPERSKTASISPPTVSPSLPREEMDKAAEVIRSVFAPNSKVQGGNTGPENLVATLESTLRMKRDAWPAAVIREFASVLLGVAGGRSLSPQHEVRWLNLLGFCLRPGFGAPGDELRVQQVRKSMLAGPSFEREVQSEVQWLVLLRRIAGGLNASQQHELYRKLLPSLGVGSKKKHGRVNPQVEFETWRLLVSLEHLPADIRSPLGDELAVRVSDGGRWLWPLARLGARIPLYGPLLCVTSPEKSAEWLAALLELESMSPEVVNAIVELARYTGDLSRDVAPEMRSAAVRALRGTAEQEQIRRVQEFVAPDRRDAVRSFGESLPLDLRLVTSADCLLSLVALNPEPEKAA